MSVRSKKEDLFRDIEHIDLGSYEQMSGMVQKSGLFLGVLSHEDMWSLMRKSGLVSHLERKGFTELTSTIFTDENDIDHLGVFDESGELIIDLRLSRKRYVWGLDDPYERAYDMIVIEWLSTRNPRRTVFTKERPQLPGQQYPGLGCLRQLLRMMELFSKRMSCDGFLDVPDHLHLSLMYSRSFFFIDAEKEGTLRALLSSLKGESLYDIAWASVTEAIIDDLSGLPYRYVPAEQLFAISGSLKSYFSSDLYRERVKENSFRQFYLDHDMMNRRRNELLKKNKASEM
ncbi:MAG: hypothetical protein ACOCWH_00560 [Spirochaetota bacterium]